VDEVIDELRDLKQKASELEDENRHLREKLRFNSDASDFRNPFWYEKTHPERPLCAKCFADEKIGPMSELRQGAGSYRRCLVCATHVEVEPFRPPAGPGSRGGFGGPNSWLR
jgi:hypothetical protein